MPVILLVSTFLGFARNSFEKRQVDECCFSKEFHTNPRNVSTNRKTGIALLYLFSEESGNSQDAAQ
jgi:hypothetical protein